MIDMVGKDFFSRNILNNKHQMNWLKVLDQSIMIITRESNNRDGSHDTPYPKPNPKDINF